MQTESSKRLKTRVIPRISPQQLVCRCGTRLPPGSSILTVADWHPTVARLLKDQSFCSVACLRAWFLESLNELDALDTPENESLVLDLRSVFIDLVLAFADLEELGLDHGGPPLRR